MAEANENKTVTVKTGNFFERNEKLLTYVVGGLIVVGVGVFGYLKFIREPKEVESQQAWWSAYNDLKNDSLDNALQGSPGGGAGALSLAKKYEGFSGENVANLIAGLSYLKKGELQPAITHFEKCEFEDQIIQAQVLGDIGNALSESGNYAEAAAKFQEAAETNANSLTSPHYYKKAGIHYMEAGMNSEALSAFQKIREEYPKSREGEDIEKWIARLNS